MRTVITTGPTAEPILLEELKDNLRLDGADEDASLGAFINTARSLIEDHANLMMIDRSLDLFMDAWPLEAVSGHGHSHDVWWSGVADGSISVFEGSASYAPLPVRPVSQINSISTVAADGSETLWAAANYFVRPGLKPAIALAPGGWWPVPDKSVDGIKISLTAGFGASWNHVPASQRQAVLMLAGYLYGNRGEQGSSGALKASGAANLLRPYRERRL